MILCHWAKYVVSLVLMDKLKGLGRICSEKMVVEHETKVRKVELLGTDEPTHKNLHTHNRGNLNCRAYCLTKLAT